MKLRSLMAVMLASIVALSGNAQPAHTPQVGSAERQAICDAARAHFSAKYLTAPVPQPIVFKIDHLRVLDDYANFEAIPLLKDGSYLAPRYAPDIGLNFCLRKTASDWKVIVDLSRTDVPDGAELAGIKRSLPSDFPLSLFSPTWRDLLNKSP